MLIRSKYLKKLMPFVGKPIIKVITGQRRIGKSFLLRQIADKLDKTQFDIISIDKEKLSFDFIKNYKDLVEYIEQKKVQKKLAVFIDEIQDIENFELALRNFHDNSDYDFYITGSTATLLSGDLATNLSGRIINIKMEGLSLEEFTQIHQFENSGNTLILYFQYGGMPGLSMFKFDADSWTEYINNIFSTILYKDVIKRNNIRNVHILEKLIEFIADSIGSLLSARSIVGFLKSQQLNISVTTILEYLKFLESSYIIQKAKRQDIKGKRILEVGEKYYFTDLGIRNGLVGYKITDIHKLLENAVYNHLKYCGYLVTVGDWQRKEIDFVGIKNKEKIYIQVCYQMSTKETIEREFGNLLMIKDQYPKYVVGMDLFAPANTYEGIEYIKIESFLLNSNW